MLKQKTLSLYLKIFGSWEVWISVRLSLLHAFLQSVYNLRTYQNFGIL